MTDQNSFLVFLPIIIVMGLALLVVGGGFLVSYLIAPKGKDYKNKDTAYECGEEPTGSAWSSFNVRFYVVGLIFIIFDVESALMFPVVSVFKDFVEAGKGSIILVEVLLFLFILISGIAYCWRKGDLDWVRSYSKEDQV